MEQTNSCVERTCDGPSGTHVGFWCLWSDLARRVKLIGALASWVGQRWRWSADLAEQGLDLGGVGHPAELAVSVGQRAGSGGPRRLRRP